MTATAGTWGFERGTAFEAMLDPAMFGTTLLFQGQPYQCIAPEQEIIKAMKENLYESNQTGGFAMRGTDFTASGITDRCTIQYQGSNFEVYSYTVDPVDCHVDLKVFYKQ